MTYAMRTAGTAAAAYKIQMPDWSEWLVAASTASSTRAPAMSHKT